MKRFANILMIIGFALLQCTAPLAHAHIEGSSPDNVVHLPEAGLPDVHDSSKLHHSGSIVETQDLGVQCDDRLEEYITAHVLAAGYLLHTLDETTVRHYRSPVHPLSFPSTRSHESYPQAPPARSTM